MTSQLGLSWQGFMYLKYEKKAFHSKLSETKRGPLLLFDLKVLEEQGEAQDRVCSLFPLLFAFAVLFLCYL